MRQKRMGLKINIAKSKEIQIITANSDNLYLNNNLIERVNQFTYLGSIIDGSVVTETDVATRIQEARMALGALHKIWNSRAHSAGTKLRLFNSSTKSVLLYCCETRKASKTFTEELQIFINECLRRILRIFWPIQISNNDLWTRTNQIRTAGNSVSEVGVAGPYTS
jgi:hypothetical protein